jgi:hypothetical protein
MSEEQKVVGSVAAAEAAWLRAGVAHYDPVWLNERLQATADLLEELAAPLPPAASDERAVELPPLFEMRHLEGFHDYAKRNARAAVLADRASRAQPVASVEAQGAANWKGAYDETILICDRDLDADDFREGWEAAHRAAPVAQPPATGAAVAWLVQGSKTWQDAVYLREDTARTSCDRRKDGSTAMPLGVLAAAPTIATPPEVAPTDDGPSVEDPRAAGWRDAIEAAAKRAEEIIEHKLSGIWVAEVIRALAASPGALPEGPADTEGGS